MIKIYFSSKGPDFARDSYKEQNENLINIGRIEGIMRYNAFQSESYSKSFEEKQAKKVKKIVDDSSGLWILPSYFNHSCEPNAIRIFYGDIMMIYSSRDTKAGDELTMPYFELMNVYESREESCKNYGFECDCKRCDFERRQKTKESQILRKNILKKVIKINIKLALS